MTYLTHSYFPRNFSNGTNLPCTNNRAKKPRSCHSLQGPRGMSTARLGLPSSSSNDSRSATISGTRPASSATASTSSEAGAFLSFFLSVSMACRYEWTTTSLTVRSPAGAVSSGISLRPVSEAKEGLDVVKEEEFGFEFCSISLSHI